MKTLNEKNSDQPQIHNNIRGNYIKEEENEKNLVKNIEELREWNRE